LLFNNIWQMQADYSLCMCGCTMSASDEVHIKFNSRFDPSSTVCNQHAAPCSGRLPL